MQGTKTLGSDLRSTRFFAVNEVSREGAKARREPEELSAIVVDCAYHLHVEVGPGLLESVYEVVLARMLQDRGLAVRRQVSVPIRLMNHSFDEGFRADLIVEDVLFVELKSVENLSPVHSKQVLTYLRLLGMPLGLLVNFGAATFKEGIRRIVNQHRDFAASREPESPRLGPMNHSINESSFDIWTTQLFKFA